MRPRRNNRTIRRVVAYLDGELLVDDVLQAALDNHMMLDDLKRRLVAENPGHKVEFKVTGGRGGAR